MRCSTITALPDADPVAACMHSSVSTTAPSARFCCFCLDQVNSVSKRREYHGELKQWVDALSDAPHGGQIIVDRATFAGINLHLTDILKVVPPHPDYETMSKYRR